MSLLGKNLTFGYKKNVPLFNNVNISINPGQVVGLHGYSGSGKTTLGKVLAGYNKQWNGEVLVDGNISFSKGFNPVQIIHQHPEKSVNPLWKMNQVLDECDEDRQALMDQFGIDKQWLNRWPIELSGGELQRFCIARAFHSKTKYIIADEITTMLDGITQASIWHTIIRETQKRKIGVLIITHDMALLHKLSDVVINFNSIKQVE